MKLSSMIVLAAVLVPAAASGAEYHIYKDASGIIVLSNLTVTERPADRALGSLAIVKNYDWADATAEDIAATEKENREAALASALRDLASQSERVADETKRSNEIALDAVRRQTQQASTEINQVIVSTHRLRHPRFRNR